MGKTETTKTTGRGNMAIDYNMLYERMVQEIAEASGLIVEDMNWSEIVSLHLEVVQ